MAADCAILANGAILRIIIFFYLTSFSELTLLFTVFISRPITS